MIKELTWDSIFFKRKIGELTADSYSPSYVKKALDKAKEDGFEYVSCKLKFQDTLLIRLLESLGFYLTDVGLILGIETEKFTIPHFGKGGDGGILQRTKSVKVATYQDIPVLKRMIKSLFHESRFYSDPFFSKKEADRLYQTWIENSVKGRVADVVLYIPNAGFITCRKSKRHAGDIVLIGIKKNLRGKGFGTALIGEAMKWFKAQDVKSIGARTQLKNINAVNFYLRLGFFPKEYDIRFGKIL